MGNRQAKYYTEVGSYRGVIKIKGRWVSAKEINRICKVAMVRWQGPPSKAIVEAMKNTPVRADILLPNTWTINQIKGENNGYS